MFLLQKLRPAKFLKMGGIYSKLPVDKWRDAEAEKNSFAKNLDLIQATQWDLKRREIGQILFWQKIHKNKCQVQM
jgi:hypothetical protein